MASSDRRRRRLLPPGTDLLEFLLSLPPEAREEGVRRLGFTEAEAFDLDWPTWAHDGQRPPANSEWSTCVIMGGRGFGKTRAGSNWIAGLVAGTSTRTCPLRIALVGATLAEARRVMVEGPSGLLEVAGPWIRLWRPSLGFLRFRTGAEAQLFSGHSPELLRGPAHDYAWCDELAKREKAGETWDMLQFGLRRGTRPRALVTTTPRPGPVLRAIMANPGCVVIGGPSDANPHNSPAWQRDMAARYAGTRLGRQELGGELLADTPGALWTVELLEKCRRSRTAPSPLGGEGWGEGVPTPGPRSPTVEPPLSNSLPSGERGFFSSRPDENGGGVTSPGSHFGSAAITLIRIIIAVDPPSGDGTCGIVACAKDEAGTAHVLADHSVTARSPEGWSRAVADAARIHSLQSSPRFRGEGDHLQGGGGASSGVPVLIVAEKNQGGAMVAAVLHTADPNLRVKLVTATVGKAERAAPVAMLFEAGKVLLHGRFPALEAELLGMIAGGDYEGPGVSPDRADAMVWALTELMLGKERAAPSIRQL